MREKETLEGKAPILGFGLGPPRAGSLGIDFSGHACFASSLLHLEFPCNLVTEILRRIEPSLTPWEISRKFFRYCEALLKQFVLKTFNECATMLIDLM